MVFQIENTCDTLKEMDVAKLFDCFYRCDSARTQKDGGYGIGLSAAQAIANTHGETITASAENGSAIRFTIKL